MYSLIILCVSQEIGVGVVHSCYVCGLFKLKLALMKNEPGHTAQGVLHVWLGQTDNVGNLTEDDRPVKMRSMTHLAHTFLSMFLFCSLKETLLF